MSYHRDHHEFDFDSDLIDMMYPMTDLDIEIAKYGASAVLKKKKKKSRKEVKQTTKERTEND